MFILAKDNMGNEHEARIIANICVNLITIM